MTSAGRLRALRVLLCAAAVTSPALAATGCASAQDQSTSSNVSSGTSSSAPTTAPSAPATTPPPSVAPPTAATCRTSELKVSLVSGGVAAGTWAAMLEFTDTGNAACTMTGWPGVAGITSSGTASPAMNRSGPMDGLDATGVPRVTLQPGGKAGIDISGTDNSAGGGSCPLPYRQLRVSAPGDSVSVTIPAITSAFSTGLPSCGPLAASPVHPLSSFSFSGQ
jgi:hypothetical protein